MSLDEAISARRSLRSFKAKSISRLELSQLLWAAQGVTDDRDGYRAVPSTGATYPLEIFAVCGRGGVEDMDEGVYYYRVGGHSLTLYQDGDVRDELAEAAFSQKFIKQAPLSIVICAVYSRTVVGYSVRGERYVHMEVGHAGQNIYLQAVALGLATVAVGAFDDQRVVQVLRLGREYEPLYIMPVGRPA